MPTLPSRPSLEHLKNQAKALLDEVRSPDREARARFEKSHPRPEKGKPALADAQLVIAREYGFTSWPRLKTHVEGLMRALNETEKLRRDFAEGDASTRERVRRQRAPESRRDLFEDPDPDSTELSENDARVILAGEHGYHNWLKYESFLHLEPGVREVLAAIDSGDVDGLRRLLEHEPELANPAWVPGYGDPLDIDWPHLPNDSVPLFCVTEAVFRDRIDQDTGTRIARLMLEHGADPDIARNQPMEGAVSFDCPGILRALIEHGADLEGSAPGVLMAYPMFFGYTECTEIMAEAGVTLDLRFAAGLGRIDEMERFVNADGSLVPDPGLADPYGSAQVGQGKSPIRAERTRDEILGQALAYACVHDRRQAADWLLGHDANPSAICHGFAQPCTALHLVIQHTRAHDIEERWKMIEWLLDHGSDPSVRDPITTATRSAGPAARDRRGR